MSNPLTSNNSPRYKSSVNLNRKRYGPTTTLTTPLQQGLTHGTASPSEASVPSSTNSFQTVIRVRPFLPGEGSEDVVLMQPSETEDKITILERSPPYVAKEVFVFDRVFWHMNSQTPSEDQESIFEYCAVPIIDGATEGYNGTIMAYGQTSSGKTHTMVGSDAHPGIIPRLCTELFQNSHTSLASPTHHHNNNNSTTLDDSTSDSSRNDTTLEANLLHHPTPSRKEFSVSFMEIYNDHVFNLLDPTPNVKLKVRNHPLTGTFVDGLSKEPVSCADEAMRCIARGNENRHVGFTKMNEQSSRSHAIFQIWVRLTDRDGKTLHAKINLVDLAGSERVKQTAAEGERLKEARDINQSLSCLRRVIDALIGRSPYIPYRESTLTWILSESFGGNARSFLIGNLCPHSAYFDETCNTLQYVAKTRDIVNVLVRNEDVIHATRAGSLYQQHGGGGGPHAGAAPADPHTAALLSSLQDTHNTVLRTLEQEREGFQQEKMELETRIHALQLDTESLYEELARERDRRGSTQSERDMLLRRFRELERELGTERSRSTERLIRAKKKLETLKFRAQRADERVEELEKENTAFRTELSEVHAREAESLRTNQELITLMIATSYKLQSDLEQYELVLRTKHALLDAEIDKVLGASGQIVSMYQTQVLQLRYEMDLAMHHHHCHAVQHAATDRAPHALSRPLPLPAGGESTVPNPLPRGTAKDCDDHPFSNEVPRLRSALQAKEKELQRAYNAIADVCAQYIAIQDLLRSLGDARSVVHTHAPRSNRPGRHGEGTTTRPIQPPAEYRHVMERLREFCCVWERNQSTFAKSSRFVRL